MGLDNPDGSIVIRLVNSPEDCTLQVHLFRTTPNLGEVEPNERQGTCAAYYRPPRVLPFLPGDDLGDVLRVAIGDQPEQPLAYHAGTRAYTLTLRPPLAAGTRVRIRSVGSPLVPALSEEVAVVGVQIDQPALEPAETGGFRARYVPDHDLRVGFSPLPGDLAGQDAATLVVWREPRGDQTWGQVACAAFTTERRVDAPWSLLSRYAGVSEGHGALDGARTLLRREASDRHWNNAVVVELHVLGLTETANLFSQ